MTKIGGVAAVLWLLHGLLWAEQLVDGAVAGMPRIGWGEALQTSLIGLSLCWLLLSIAMTWLVQRHPLERGRLVAGLMASVAAIAVGIVGRALFVWLLDPWLAYWYGGEPPGFVDVLWHSLRINFTLALIIVGLAHGWVTFQRLQANRLRIAELEARVSQARLDALTAQVNPHFLFNAFNSIAELMHHDSHASDRMLVALSRLLRRSLELGTGHEVRLSDELDLLRDYLAIEQIRLGERLRVVWSIDPACADAWIPTLLLQPLVENAIVHGIARRRLPGEIRIVVAAAAGVLHIDIDNDAADADVSPVSGSGIGVGNVRERLKRLHGDAASITLESRDAQRHRVCLRLPLRTQASALAVPV